MIAIQMSVDELDQAESTSLQNFFKLKSTLTFCRLTGIMMISE